MFLLLTKIFMGDPPVCMGGLGTANAVIVVAISIRVRRVVTVRHTSVGTVVVPIAAAVARAHNSTFGAAPG